jgi:RNA polymerase sigma-70 factor (ECF subfamily)
MGQAGAYTGHGPTAPPAMSIPASFRQQLLDAIPRLRRYARSLVFDVHAADDLVQTSLERALARWHQYDQERDLLAWLLGIVHHAHLDERRKAARFVALEELDPAALQQAGGAFDATGARLDLLRALARLPEAQREPLLLVSVEQLSYAECARVLNLPIGTVMSRIARGRAALRLWLDGDAERSGSRPRTAHLKRVV